MILNWRYSPETPNLGKNRRFLEPCDLVIWRMTSKNNRAPLLCYFKFVHHFVAIGEFKLELQSGNAQFGLNSTIFRAVWPWNLTYDLEKTIGHLFYATSSFVHHFVAIGEFKLELQSGNAQFGSNYLCDLHLWPLTLNFCMDVTFAICNNNDDTMMGT